MPRRASLDPTCPSIERALRLLGRPWTGQVLTALQDGPLRFSELSERLGDCGDKVLSARLKELEARSLLRREVDPGPPVKVRYLLTPVGEKFRDVVEAIDAWGRMLPAPREPARRSG